MHTMILQETYKSGAQSWKCDKCDREVIVQWRPFARIVLDPGDETAQHSGGVGVVMGDMEAGEEVKLPKHLQDIIERLERGGN